MYVSAYWSLHLAKWYISELIWAQSEQAESGDVHSIFILFQILNFFFL